VLAWNFRYGWEEVVGCFPAGLKTGFQRKSPGLRPGLPNLWSGKGDSMITLWLKAIVRYVMTLEVKLRIRKRHR
jgi:hypothetical protein